MQRLEEVLPEIDRAGDHDLQGKDHVPNPNPNLVQDPDPDRKKDDDDQDPDHVRRNDHAQDQNLVPDRGQGGVVMSGRDESLDPDPDHVHDRDHVIANEVQIRVKTTNIRSNKCKCIVVRRQSKTMLLPLQESVQYMFTVLGHL